MADTSSHSRTRVHNGGPRRAVASVLIVICVSAAAAAALTAIGSHHVADADEQFRTQQPPAASAPSSAYVGKHWVQLDDGVGVSAKFQLADRTIWLVSEPGGSGCPWFHRLVWHGLAGPQEATLEPCGAYVGTTVHDGQLMLVFHAHSSDSGDVPRQLLEVEEQLVPLMPMSAPTAPALNRLQGKEAA